MIGTSSTHANAGNLLNELIDLDQQHIDLSDLLRGSTSQHYTQPLLENASQFMHFDSVMPPKELADAVYVGKPTPQSHLLYSASINASSLYIDTGSHYFQGILPEIGQVWFTKDNILYLWDYVGGSEKYRYQDQYQIINAVGVIKPKPGVFGDNVQHVFVLATPVEVILLGVGRTTLDGSSSLSFTELSTKTNNTEMTSIHGTDNGRIFMCGKDDHHIYEVQYKGPSLSATPSLWSTRSCAIYCWTKTLSAFNLFSGRNNLNPTAITIDDERNVLYAFSDSSIELYYLGVAKDQFISIAKYTDIANSAILMCRQNSMLYAASDFAIQDLQVVPTSESRKIHLIAITKRGFRLYFTHQRDALRNGYLYPSNIKLTPNALELVHVRLPPPPTSSINQMTQTYPKIGSSYYGSGVLLLSQPYTDDKDTIYMSSATLGSTLVGNAHQQLLYIESVSGLNMNGKVWSIAEANTPNKGKHPISDIASNLIDEPREFLVLTDSGLSYFKKQRPIDILHQLLLNYDETKTETFQRDLQVLVNQYGQTQVCAMCLGIICVEREDIGRRAKQVFFDYGGNPSVSSTRIANDQPTDRSNVNYSGKHNGLALYFSRLVSDVWKTKVFEIIPQTNQTGLSSKIQSRLFSIQTNLSKLKRFMDLNPAFHSISSLKDIKFQSSDNSMIQPLLAEQQSVHELYQLLNQCIEAIYFIDFIIDANLKDVLQCVPESIRKEMMDTSLESMLTFSRGVELKRDLVVAAIHKYGSNYLHAGYDIVSDFLQRKCPSFFKPSDMAFYKGVENLVCATKEDVDYERTTALDKSLDYLKEAAGTITDDKLAEICTQYRYQGYYVGVVKLALERAKQLDPQNQGLTYIEDTGSLELPSASPAPPADSGAHFYQLRLQCYQQILHALTEVRKLQQGGNVRTNSQSIRSDNPDAVSAEVLSTALSSDDILFHYTLYQWFLMESKHDSRMLMELLSFDTPYIVPFIKEYVDVFEGLGFLGEYCRRREQYYEAALYLEALAMESPNISNGTRMEYLGKATFYARARDPNHLEVQEATQLLQRLEQQMETLQSTMYQ